MTCASCSARVERALGRLPGVLSASVNLAVETRQRHARQPAAGGEAAVALAPVPVSAADPQAAIERDGYTARELPPAADPSAATAAAAASERREQHDRRALLLTAWLALRCSPRRSASTRCRPAGWLQLALAAPVEFVLGARFQVAGWKALCDASDNMDLLVALAVIGSAGLTFAGWWPGGRSAAGRPRQRPRRSRRRRDAAAR